MLKHVILSWKREIYKSFAGTFTNCAKQKKELYFRSGCAIFILVFPGAVHETDSPEKIGRF
jgi:hypothetical protein